MLIAAPLTDPSARATGQSVLVVADAADGDCFWSEARSEHRRVRRHRTA
jgi:hypothetical protein